MVCDILEINGWIVFQQLGDYCICIDLLRTYVQKLDTVVVDEKRFELSLFIRPVLDI